MPGYYHSRIVNLAAAISLGCSGASASPISVIPIGEAAPPAYFERTQISESQMLLSGYIIRHDVKDRAIRHEGNDALAIGLIDRTHQGDWPYYGYGDYYGKGDYFKVDTPSLRCRE